MTIRYIFALGALLFLAASIGLAPCAGDDDQSAGESVFDSVNTPLDGLLKKAADEGKPLLLLFDSEGCGWCQILHDEVLSRSDVREELRSFVVAQYVEGHDAATPVLARFHVDAFPTTLVLDGTGTEIDRLPGYEKPEAYIADLRRMLAGKDTLKSLLALGSRRSVAQVRCPAVKLAMSDPTRGVAFCDEMLAARDDLGDEDRAWLLLQRAEALTNAGTHESALATADRLMREYPNTKAAKIAVVQAISALVSVSPERALRFIFAAPRPEDPKARDYLDNHVMILHLRAAEACMARQAERHSKDAEMLNILAWESYQRGLDTKKAIEWARSAVELSDRAPHILDTLAHLLYVNRQIDEAIELESEALERASSERERWQYEEALAKFKAVKAVRERREAQNASAPEVEEASEER